MLYCVGCLHHPPLGNAAHALRTQCKVLYVGNNLTLSFGPFPQVCCSVIGFLKLFMHSGYGIVELLSIVTCFHPIVPLLGYVSGVFSLPSKPKRVDDPYAGPCGRLWLSCQQAYAGGGGFHNGTLSLREILYFKCVQNFQHINVPPPFGYHCCDQAPQNFFWFWVGGCVVCVG